MSKNAYTTPKAAELCQPGEGAPGTILASIDGGAFLTELRSGDSAAVAEPASGLLLLLALCCAALWARLRR